MDYLAFLGALGLSQSMAEILLVTAFVVIFIGVIFYFFWKFIVSGFVVLAIVSVFLHHGTTEQPKPETIPEDTAKTEYMKDCVSLTHKLDMCKDLWEEHHSSNEEIIIEEKAEEKIPEGFVEAKDSKLLDVDNEKYNNARALALRKPGAIVMHSTIR
jgi:hypothetical protein